MLYLKGTSDYSITYKKVKPGTSASQQQPDKGDDEAEEVQADRDHLLEIFATQTGQETSTAGSQCLVQLFPSMEHCSTATEKSIAVSSAEAEYTYRSSQ